MNIPTTNDGFTLTECLIILALIAILTTIASINGGSWFTQQQSRVGMDQLVHDLKFARQQAILRKTIITICPTTDFEQCADYQAWKNGYLIFIDPMGTGRISTNTTTVNLNRLTALGLLSNSRDYVQFAADGSSRSTNSTFIYRVDNTEYRAIINLPGRIRVEH